MVEENPRLSGEYWNKAAEKEAHKCVFCDLKEKYVIKSGDQATLTVNIFPYIDGQLLVVPHRHIERFEELNPEEVLAMHELTTEGVNLLKERLDIQNVWIILRDGDTSGKTVRHLHTNIMPYNDRINTWHYQNITIEPIDLASRLRAFSKNARA